MVQLEIEDLSIEYGINWDDYSLVSSHYYDDLPYYSYIDYWNCPWDYLAIYDSINDYDEDRKIGVYCGDLLGTVIRTTGRHMYLKFVSDDQVVDRGFKASFTFVELPPCLEQYEEPSIITSPDYPDNYPDNVDCAYSIVAPEYMTIELVIQDFHLQQGINWDSYSISSHDVDFPICPFDYLSVYDGPEEDESQLIGVYCGILDDIPLVIRSTGNQLYVKFKTDVEVNERGFQGFFTFVESISCGGVYENPGIIYSINYPGSYPADFECDYTILAPSGYEVRLTILDFELEDAEFCTKDVLVVYDADYADSNSYIGTFCGTSISSQFQSTNSSLFLHLQSDGEGEGRGFNARFEFVGKYPLIFLCVGFLCCTT